MIFLTSAPFVWSGGTEEKSEESKRRLDEKCVRLPAD